MCNIIRYTLSGAEEGKRAEDRSQTTEQSGSISRIKFMLPDAQHLPPQAAQGAVYPAIPGPVARDLLPPEGGVGLSGRRLSEG